MTADHERARRYGVPMSDAIAIARTTCPSGHRAARGSMGPCDNCTDEAVTGLALRARAADVAAGRTKR